MMPFHGGGFPLAWIATEPDPLNHDALIDTIICHHGTQTVTRLVHDRATDVDQPDAATYRLWAIAARLHDERFGCTCASSLVTLREARAMSDPNVPVDCVGQQAYAPRSLPSPWSLLPRSATFFTPTARP